MARPAHPTRREDILGAAREEFSSRGFAGARLEDIARRAGISKAAIYLQFESKEAIFRALVTEILETMLPQIAPPDPGEMSSEHLIRQFIAMAFAHFTSKELVFLPRMILGEGQNFPELARFYHDHAILRVTAIIEAMIRRGIERGEFDCAMPQYACHTIISGVVLAALWRIVFEPVGAEALDINGAGQAHADTLLNGLLVRKES